MTSLISDLDKKLDESIFQLLTQEPNKWMPISTLYNLYTKENPKYTPNKKNFIMICEVLNGRFKNVRKCHKNNICNLAFVTNENLPIFSNALDNIEFLEKDFKPVDSVEMIEYMIDNPECVHSLSLNEYWDGTDTVTHILFKNGRLEPIKKLLDRYAIDFSVKNVNGKSLLDVIDYSSKDAANLVELYYLNLAKDLRSKFDKEIDLVKTNNTFLLDKNKKLSAENNQLISKLSTFELLRWGFGATFVAFMANLYFFAKN